MKNFYLSNCFFLLSSVSAFATTYDVTTGADSTTSYISGSYRSSIQDAEINGGSHVIQITSSGSPVTLVGNMGDGTTRETTITGTITIQSNSSGTSRTVNGSGFTALDIGRYGYVTISPDVIYQNSNFSVKGSLDSYLIFTDPKNYTSLVSGNSMFLEGSNLIFAAGTGTLASAVVLTGSQNISFKDDVTISGVISGSGSFAKQGGGDLILSAVNTYSGGTTVSEGAIALKGSGALPSATAVALGSSGTLDISGVNSSSTIGSLSGSSGSKVVLGSKKLIVGNSTSTTMGGVISGTGMLEKKGSGLLTLSGENSFSGGITLSQGQITATNNKSLGPGYLSMASGTTLAMGSDVSLDNAISINGESTINVESGTAALTYIVTYTGNLKKTGVGNLVLSGTNNFTGGVTLSQGTITAGNNSALGTGLVSMSDGTTLAIRDGISLYQKPTEIAIAGVSTINVLSGTGTCSNVIRSTGTLKKTGMGTLVLSGTNTYSGGTTLSEGQITADHNSALGTSPLAMATETTLAIGSGKGITNKITIAGISTINVASGTATLSGVISSSENLTGTLKKTGMGTLVLSGQNTYSGGTTLSEGQITVGYINALGVSTLVMADTTILSIVSGISVENLITISGTSTMNVASGTATFSGVISSNGNLTKTGMGILALTKVNTYSGATTTVSEGTIALKESGALPSTTAVALGSSGTLDISGVNSSSTIGSLSGNSGSTVVLGSKKLIVGNSTSTTMGGVISGTGMLEKKGSGTLTLSGENSFSGGTTVSAGVLALSGSGTLASTGGLTLSSSGSFDISGVTTSSTIGSLTGSSSTTVVLGSKTLTVGDATSTGMGGVISGTGVVTKQGSGTLTLSGTNTYSGGTTLSEGQITANANSSLGSGTLSMADTTTLAITSGRALSNAINIDGTSTVNIAVGTVTLSGVISSNGNLTKTGMGILALTNVNTYSGGTTLSEGGITANQNSALGGSALTMATETTLAIGSGISLSNAISIIGSSTFNVNTGTGSLLGQISGSGMLVKTGVANLSLYSKNIYTGGTHIEEGSITAYNCEAFGTGEITWEEGTSYTYETGSTCLAKEYRNCVVNGEISLDSVLADVGSVDFILNQSLTWSNDQIIKGQWWVTPWEGVIANLSGNIQTDAEMLKDGSGTLFLFGNNAFGGPIALREGSIGIGSDTALGTSTVNAQGGTTLNFNPVVVDNTFHIEGDVTFSSESNAEIRGQILGDDSSTFIKTGMGILYLSHENPIQVSSGIVSSGTLTTQGVSNASWEVMEGALLDFCPNGINTGSIDVYGRVSGNLTNHGNVHIYSQGAISAGCSIGDVNIDGSLILEPYSMIYVEVGNLGNDFYTISDTFEIGDQVGIEFVTTADYNRINRTFAFLNAGSIVAPPGGFTAVLTSNPLLEAQVRILGDTIGVEIQKQPFTEVILAGNASRVGNAIDEVTSTDNLTLVPIISSLISLGNIDAVTDALNQMQPAMFKGLAISQENNIVNIQEILGYRMQNVLDRASCHQIGETACSKEEQMINVWIDGFGDALHQKSNVFANSQQFGYQSNTAGAVAGVDAHFANYFYAGALGGYTNTDTSYANNQGSGGVNTGYAGVYFSAIGERLYGNVSVTGGWSGYSGNRRVSYTGVDVTAVNNHNGQQILTHADTGFNLGWKGFTVRPFDSFNYVVQTEDAYTESGAGVYNLNVAKSHANLLRNELGVQFAGCICVGQSSWTISPKLSWVREVRTSGRNYTSEFVDTNVQFTTTGYFPDRSLLSAGIMVSGSMWDDRLAIDLYYNGDFGSLYSDHNYGGQIRFGF